MNLYLISQTENQGYDTYDSAVVAAKDEEAARNTQPGQYGKWGSQYSTWCQKPEQVTVQYLGKADKSIKKGVVCASFNAG